MKKKRAKLTYVIIGMLIIAFVIDYFILHREGINISSSDYILKGSSWGYLTKYGRLLNVRAMHSQWWRLLTSVFLHTGAIQLGISCLGLFSIGSVVEKAIGSGKLLFYFIFSAIISSVITMFVTDESTGTGGAIYGLAGVLIVLIIQDRKNSWSPVFILKKLLIIVYIVLSNLTGVKAIVMHEVGLITGIVLGFIYCSVKQLEEKEQKV